MKGFLTLSLIYLSIILLMLPLYDKAYLDDFAYAQSVKHLLLDGSFKISDWSAVTLITQIYWGAFFSRLFGFSFTTLTYSTLVLFYFGLIAFYLLCLELRCNDFQACLFTLAFLGFPWILLLAYSFLSDIPYLSLFLICLFFYVKGFNKRSNKYLFIASLFACLSFLIRQTGLVLPVAAGLATGLNYWKKNGNNGFVSSLLSAVTVPAITIFIYYNWQKVGNHQTYGQIYTIKHILWPTFSNFPVIIFRIIFYFVNIFIFLWPLLFIYVSQKNLKKLLRKNILSFITVFISLLFIGLVIINLFPNSLSNLFPVQKKFVNNYSLFLAIIPYQILTKIWILNMIFALAVLSVALVLIAPQSWSQLKGIKRFKLSTTFVFFSFFLLFIWILILPFRWAEYTVTILPYVMIGMSSISQKINKQIALIIIVFLITFSFLNAKITHTVLGKVWHEAEKLVKSGVSPEVIDTGQYAWYPWWYYEETFSKELAKVGGDKNKLTRLQTWEFPQKKDYQYRFKY